MGATKMKSVGKTGKTTLKAFARIDEQVFEHARLVAAHRRSSAAQVISDLVREPLAREYAKVIREAAERVGG